jgi:hypothetical protein
MEAAVTERRLRLSVNSEGIITAVSKDTPCQHLFGFEASHVRGSCARAPGWGGG